MKDSETTEQWASTGQRDERGRLLPGHSLRWQPGQSGNPLGRSLSVTDSIRRKMAEINPDNGRPFADSVADVLIQTALGGSVPALKELLDRLEGKASQAIDLDLTLHDWRVMALQWGVDEHDVIDEARRIIECSDDRSDSESN